MIQVVLLLYDQPRQHIQRRQWHPTPVLLPGKSHGLRSLVGCSPWGREESGTTEQLFPFLFSLACIGEGNGNPLQCSCLETPRDAGAWWAAVCGVAQSRTQLKRLSRSSMFEGLWNRSEEVLRSGAWLWKLCGVNIEETWVVNAFRLYSGAPELGFLFWKVRSGDTLQWHLRVTWEVSKTRNAWFQPRRLWLNVFWVGGSLESHCFFKFPRWC